MFEWKLYRTLIPRANDKLVETIQCCRNCFWYDYKRCTEWWCRKWISKWKNRKEEIAWKNKSNGKSCLRLYRSTSASAGWASDFLEAVFERGIGSVIGGLGAVVEVWGAASTTNRIPGTKPLLSTLRELGFVRLSDQSLVRSLRTAKKLYEEKVKRGENISRHSSIECCFFPFFDLVFFSSPVTHPRLYRGAIIGAKVIAIGMKPPWPCESVDEMWRYESQ